MDQLQQSRSRNIKSTMVTDDLYVNAIVLSNVKLVEPAMHDYFAA